MRKQCFILVAALSLFGVCFVLRSQASPQQDVPHAPTNAAMQRQTRWNYSVHQFSATDDIYRISQALDGAGNEGWELVSFGQVLIDPYPMGTEQPKPTLLAIFKKPE